MGSETKKTDVRWNLRCSDVGMDTKKTENTKTKLELLVLALAWCYTLRCPMLLWC